MKAYKKLETRFREMAVLRDAEAILHWDAATMLQPGSQESRGEQLAVLAAMRHRMINDPAIGDLLAEAKAGSALYNPWQRANLVEMERSWQHQTCLPEALVSQMVRCFSESEFRWRDARANNDFVGFKPYLEQILKLVREKAAIKSEALKLEPYDALLDAYDPGMRQDFIDPLFETLKKELPPLIDQAVQKNEDVSADWSLPLAQQHALAAQLMTQLGFPMEAGRLDTSTHPFCGGAKGDIRITARYDEKDFSEGIYAVLHETGHALYENGLPEEWRYQPVGEARGMSLHESQSLFIEMQLGRSRAFCTPLFKFLNDMGKTIDIDQLYQHLISVERSFIRVDADEVTYPTHVILRYELEKAMLLGDLEVADLPGAWGDLQEKLLGVRPPTDREGCLQDIHWPGGDFGYFPTYTIGALTAAQLMEAARKALPDLDNSIEAGNFKPLTRWLKDNVHALASFKTTPEIIEAATGKPLEVTAFLAHITRRYL